MFVRVEIFKHSLLELDKASFSPLKYGSNKSFSDVHRKKMFFEMDLAENNIIEVLCCELVMVGWFNKLVGVQ